MFERELAVAKEAALAAGAAIRRIYDSEDFEVRQKEDGKGPLTEADLASNSILMDHLQRAFPDDAILSEEVADDGARLAARRVWIIDPLDGTREFTLRMPEFVVSIGLAVDGAAVLGVLYNPVTEELFTGVVGQGATYNGAPCTVTEHATLEGARLLVSRSEMKKGWFDSYGDTVELRPMGSVAYKFGLVGAGLAEATFTPKPRNEWDLIGGVAVVLAAGGRCSNGKGEDYVFNSPSPLHIGVVGSSAAFFPTTLELVQR